MKRDILYLIIIAALLFAAFFFYNRTRILRDRNDQKDVIISEQHDSIRYHKNDKGRIVSEKLAAQATAREIAKAYPQLEKELREDFDVKMKDLRAYIKNQIQVQGNGRSTVTNNYYTDSVGTKVEYRDINFDDGYLRFQSSVFEGLDFGDSRYTYTDTIRTVISGKRKWLFGKETVHAESSLSNPAAKVTGTTNILINNYRDKRFCVYVGPGYDFLNNQMTINVGVGYTLIKF